MTGNHRTSYRHKLALIVTLAVMGAGLGWGMSRNGDLEGKDQARVVNVQVDDRPLQRVAPQGASYSDVVKQVAPSVVRVQVEVRMQPAMSPGMPGFDNPLFRRFFGENSPWRNGTPQPQMPPREGMGSGVIVSDDGYILTNNHVVEKASQVRVVLPDGRELDAKVVGKDPKTDIAILKVGADDLPSIEIADSDQVEVGDVVLAVGNPFGIGQTVTSGIVSATGRATLGLDYEDFIQTDAAINPGNSGGALVDSAGRLVGINTAILSRTGGNQGIGFAVPANLARSVMESLIEHGKVVRGYLGVRIQDLTPTLAKAFDISETEGALVGDVETDSPAEKAGMKTGDVVVEFDGKAIRDSRHLKLAVGGTQPEKRVGVKVLRDGETKTLKVRLAELPDGPALAQAPAAAGEDRGTLTGVAVADLDDKARQQLDLPKHIQGALVTDVAPNSAAQKAGLRPGDVIVEINRASVASAEDAVELTAKAEHKTTLVRVWSQGGSRYLVVDETHEG